MMYIGRCTVGYIELRQPLFITLICFKFITEVKYNRILLITVVL